MTEESLPYNQHEMIYDNDDTTVYQISSIYIYWISQTEPFKKDIYQCYRRYRKQNTSRSATRNENKTKPMENDIPAAVVYFCVPTIYSIWKNTTF